MCPAGRSALNEDAGATCHRPAAGPRGAVRGRARPRGALGALPAPSAGMLRAGGRGGDGQGPGGMGCKGQGPVPAQAEPPPWSQPRARRSATPVPARCLCPTPRRCPPPPPPPQAGRAVPVVVAAGEARRRDPPSCHGEARSHLPPLPSPLPPLPPCSAGESWRARRSQDNSQYGGAARPAPARGKEGGREGGNARGREAAAAISGEGSAAPSGGQGERRRCRGFESGPRLPRSYRRPCLSRDRGCVAIVSPSASSECSSSSPN